MKLFFVHQRLIETKVEFNCIIFIFFAGLCASSKLFRALRDTILKIKMCQMKKNMCEFRVEMNLLRSHLSPACKIKKNQNKFN